MQQRVNALAQRLQQQSLDVYYCRNTSDIRWLTGFEGVFDTERAHLALVTGDGMALHTDGRYSEAMRANPASQGLEISDEGVTHAAFAAARLKGLRGAASLRIGIEADMPLDEFRALGKALEDAGIDCELVETGSPVSALRQVKDQSEIELMRRAQAITDQCFADLLTWLSAGMTEMDVANEMEYRMRRFGATGLAFSTIVASGFHSAMPHAVPSTKQLEPGDLVVIDFGAKFGDYCSDMTRTVAVGEPSAELRRIYDVTLQAQTECKARIAPGVPNKSVHELAARIIAQAGYEGRFTHSLGHGVGVDIHEAPNLSPRSTDVLAVGNVVTVEPGIYVPGVGGVRIEDFGVVTADGFDSFTQSPHELQVV